MKKILCIGGVTADIMIRAVDRFPKPGTLEAVNQIAIFVGGCAANTAIDLGRLGAPVTLCCKVGRDIWASLIEKELRDNKVDMKGITETGYAGTSVSIVLVNSEGERSFLYYPGATSELKADDIPDTLLAEHDLIFVTSAMLMHKLDGEPTAELLKKARKLGKYTAMDTAWDYEDIWMEKIGPSLPYLDLFLPSYDEAVKLTGKAEPDDIADAFLGAGVKNLVIKMGSRGAYVCEEGEKRFWSGPFLQAKPVDTNGAGDSFCAGFLCGLSNAWSYKKSAEFANAVGSLCVMGMGAYGGVVRMEKILEFIEMHKEEEKLEAIRD